MVRQLKDPRVIRCVSLSYEFDSLCREHNISLSEAVRVGISLMLAERDIKEYDNRLNIYRKMTLLRTQLEETSNELNTIKEKLNINNVFS